MTTKKPNFDKRRFAMAEKTNRQTWCEVNGIVTLAIKGKEMEARVESVQGTTFKGKITRCDDVPADVEGVQEGDTVIFTQENVLTPPRKVRQ